MSGAPLDIIVDGMFLPKGTHWQDGSVWWIGITPTIQIDLEDAYTLRSAIVQADDNDSYILEYRDLDSGDWLVLWTVPFAFGGGMQTRPNPRNAGEAYVFPSPVVTDAVRIRAINGDNLFSLSEVQIYEEVFLPVPSWQRAVAMNASVQLAWQAVSDPSDIFQNYAVYRSTLPFTNVDGMTPLATIPSIGTASFTDATANNNTSYHYAVTTVATNGTELKSVTSIGPRTPRDETDLQVVSIARTPFFPRYNPIYEGYEITESSGFGPYYFSAAVGLGSGQTEFTQRFPNVGQQVTYRATVRNRGTNTWTGTLHARFFLDNVQVGGADQSGAIPSGGTMEFTLVRAWDDLAHDLRFAIDPNDARPDNDALAINTKSVGFLSYIDESRIENFVAETPSYPGAATDDFIDWLNRHMARFNELFAEAGVGKRVHFDVLEVIPDDAPDPAIDTLPFAVFPFRYRANEGTLRYSGYYDAGDDIDYGLLHEMGHQLGLIDVYRLNLAPWQNMVSGIGYNAVQCLMNGVSHFLSEHSALAMQHWMNVAHGYFGQYLYSIPSQMRMRFLGFDGQPLKNASVRVYQKTERPGVGEIISDQVKFEGTTDTNGLYSLPNVPINPAVVPKTFAGDELHDNPFGYVAVVGNNGLLHFQVEYADSVDYAWLDITEANVAYWHGQTQDATFERRLALGGPVQICPPVELTEQNAASWAKWGDNATVTLADDYSRVKTGSASLRLETDGGYDNYARYPGDRLAWWDLSGTNTIRVWFYAENPNCCGFQERSPWIRLGSRGGIIELRPDWDILNEAIGKWVHLIIPIAGDEFWQRTDYGLPSLSAVNWIEIHADTWEAGFKLWIDGLSFDPPCKVGCN